MVEGPRHVRDGRVAIQGWLVASGCVTRTGPDVTELAADAIRRVGRRARGVAGLLSVRVHDRKARVVCDTLVDTGPRPATAALRSSLTAALAVAPFPKGCDAVVPIVVGDLGARVPAMSGQARRDSTSAALGAPA